jgi:hypothetical protein
MQKLVSILVNLIILLSISSCTSIAQSVTEGGPVATLTVDAGSCTRIDTPVSVNLDGIPLGFADAQYYLLEQGDSKKNRIPVQIEAGSPPKLWFILSDRTEARRKRVFELYPIRYELSNGVNPGGDSAALTHIEAKKDNKRLTLQRDEDRILSYYHAIMPSPEGRDEIYQRSGFIYPIWSTTGNILSEIHPKDHIHHFGIWMPWTHTRYEGNLVDFWNIQDGTGTVRFSKFISTTEGPVYGGFQAEQDHVALKTSVGEKVILKEVWDVKVYNVGGPENGYWLWDFKSTQCNITELPLIQEEYRYGGFAYRGAPQWKGQNAAYLTSEGKTQADGNGTRSRWCELSGSIDGQWEGVTIMSNPNNFRHPEPMRIIPDANYAYFVYCPSVLGEWEMKPGEDHVFRYRLYMHEGKASVEDNERLWQDYAEPPEVKITLIPPPRLASGDAGAGKSNGAVMLFDGSDFSHWVGDGSKSIGWEIEDGAMKIVPGTGSIMTRENYRDFRMHLEFKLPEMAPEIRGQDRANSGVYIQRRYEVQILDSYGLEPQDNDCGAIYKFKGPDTNACARPNQWQSYDIIFRAARYDSEDSYVKKLENAKITVWQNGVLIHRNVSIPNKTGAGRAEGPDPGPILLQDHSNEIWFRNIWIEPL